MLEFARGLTSFIESAESVVHSSKAPSTRAEEGRDPRYPSVRTPGFCWRATTPAPTPNGWFVGSRTPNVSLVVEAKSPTTNKTVGTPTAVCLGAKENRTFRDVGVTCASVVTPSVRLNEVAAFAGDVPAISTWTELRVTGCP